MFYAMDLLYPALCAAALLYAFFLAGTYLFVERNVILLALAAFFLINSATFAVLAMVTGSAPLLDIVQFRSMIVVGRVALLCILSVCIWLQFVRIKRGE